MYAKTVKLVLALPEMRPRGAASPQLDSLFRRLADERLGHCAREVEGLIWTLWLDHPDRAARFRLQAGISALAHRRDLEAQDLLDGLVHSHPGYAEAWNRRATLHFLLRRDAQSADDIARVLELEPRHFGALCGFGQICERCGDLAGALTAYEATLRINPHLPAIRERAERFRQRFSGTLH